MPSLLIITIIAYYYVFETGQLADGPSEPLSHVLVVFRESSWCGTAVLLLLPVAAALQCGVKRTAGTVAVPRQ